jgi:hypothetical protein
MTKKQKLELISIGKGNLWRLELLRRINPRLEERFEFMPPFTIRWRLG